jgi:hypothetical protein
MDHDRVVNADEANWLSSLKGLLTWASTESTSVQGRIPGDEKESLTVMATVPASGMKLPLQILAQAKIDQVHQSQVGPRPGQWVDHSDSEKLADLSHI